MIESVTMYLELRKQGTEKEVLLYGIIEALSRKVGFCYASNKYLAEELGVTPGSLAVLLSRIAKKNWVQVQLDEHNHREAIIPRWRENHDSAKELSDDPINNPLKEELKGAFNSSLNPPFNEPLNKYNKINNKRKNNSTKVLLGETPTIEVVEKSIEKKKETYGNPQINEMFDEWENIFGYKPKSDAKNRRACYNMLRAKDKGRDWLINLMKLLAESQKDEYAGRRLHNIANFSDLQYNWELVLKWGSDKYKQRGQFKEYDITNIV